MPDLYGDQTMRQRMLPYTAKAVTLDRQNDANMTQQNYLSSQRQSFTAIYLAEGTSVASLTFRSAGTAADTPLNQWASLYSEQRAKLAVTADGTTGAWASATLKTFTFATPFITTYSGLYYIGLMVNASVTVPTIYGSSLQTDLNALAPAIAVIDGVNTSLTTPASAPATFTATANPLMALIYVN